MEGRVDWGTEKNASFRGRYGFGFERVLIALTDGCLLAVREHPNRDRYAHHGQLVVDIDGYSWVVPFVEHGEGKFLKTMFPSRLATKQFLRTER